ncbi:MAG: hypothetical protein C0592_12120 [Marinilabiliales bacterium]|nr:MAG: hypothetical protein C0592_12120 [Marinilabiliales bacterium]
MKKILILSMSLFFCFGHVHAQLRDDGYSGEIHKKYNSKVVFSNDEIVYQDENETMFQTEFSYEEPIYGRMYWYPGLNNIYDFYGWQALKGYYYQMEIYLNDELLSSDHHECNRGGCTTMPLCLNPVEGDDRGWLYSGFLSKNYYHMKAGVNTITVKVYPYNIRTEEIGELISSGSFTINLTKENISSSGNYYFNGLKTYFTSGDGLWNVWKVSVNDKYGELNTIHKGEKDRWEYIFGYCSGTISTIIEGDFSSFELKSGDISILMKQETKESNLSWVISNGDHEYYLRMEVIDGAKVWSVVAKEGKITFKTTWSIGEDVWKDWIIEDELHVGAEVKMAATFLVMINTIQ